MCGEGGLFYELIRPWLVIDFSLYPCVMMSLQSFLSNDSAMTPLLVCFSLLVLMTERHPFDAVYSWLTLLHLKVIRVHCYHFTTQVY